jgi:hypothetical protein
MITAARARFELPVPQPMPTVLNMQYICETASRLLFLSVHWLKRVRQIELKYARTRTLKHTHTVCAQGEQCASGTAERTLV